MAFDGIAEGDALLAILLEYCGGRAFMEGMVDPDRLAYFDANRTKVKPYLVLNLGEPFDTADDRTIAGEEQQPMLQPFQVKGWSSDPDSARRAIAEVRVGLRGRALTANASPIRLGGGGRFSPSQNVGADTRYMRLLTGEYLLNMQVDTATP